ncbi:uncharacterized protein [Bemisia tabaci]
MRRRVDLCVHLIFATISGLHAAIIPPPWGDPTTNPCVTQPGGWQLIFWPADKKCYRIFQKGYPCPDTMELVPGTGGGPPICQCPPGSAQSAKDGRCHLLFQTAPCDPGQYFAPLPIDLEGQRWGKCVDPEPCPEDHLFWAKDKQCYSANSRGPCPEGQLLISSKTSPSIGECRCESTGHLSQYYWSPTGTCHEHYTTGPCLERGGIFLPGGKCGCHHTLPHYHNLTNRCYPLGGAGPCSQGQQFIVQVPGNRAECVCKEGYVRWVGDNACYRPYTRGPCPPGQLYSVNYTITGMEIGCIPLPCQTGRLYFPGGKGCHRVGSQGPCPPGQIVLFQDSVKTSIEGISYQGMCGCKATSSDPNTIFPMPFRGEPGNPLNQCGAQARQSNSNLISGSEDNSEILEDLCGSKRGVIQWADGTCRQLYTQGPCNVGEWIVPDRGKGQRKGRGWKVGKCECRPGFTPNRDEKTNITTCLPPVVTIAKFLNSKSYQFNNSFTSPQQKFKPSTTYRYKNHKEPTSTERSTEVLIKNTLSAENEARNHRSDDSLKARKELKEKRLRGSEVEITESSRRSDDETLETTTSFSENVIKGLSEDNARALREDLNEPEKRPSSTLVPIIDLETLFEELSSSSVELR